MIGLALLLVAFGLTFAGLLIVQQANWLAQFYTL